MSQSFLNKLSKKFGASSKQLDSTTNTLQSAPSATEQSILHSSEYYHTLKTYELLSEYHNCVRHMIHGLYVLPSQHSLYQWHAVIFIRKGYYRKSIYKFIIQFNNHNYNNTTTENIMDQCPTIYFLSHIYHPLINMSTGQLDMSYLTSVWHTKQHSNSMTRVLNYIKQIFYDTKLWGSSNKKPYNQSAYTLYQTNQLKFLQQCESCSILSMKRVYIKLDNFVIQFDQYDTIHQQCIQHIVKSSTNDMTSQNLLHIIGMVSNDQPNENQSNNTTLESIHESPQSNNLQCQLEYIQESSDINTTDYESLHLNNDVNKPFEPNNSTLFNIFHAGSYDDTDQLNDTIDLPAIDQQNDLLNDSIEINN